MGLCRVVDLGRVDYEPAWALQRELARARAEGRIADTLLLVEHPHTYTLGRRGRPDEVLAPPALLTALGARVYEVDRGGQATYHGPGQVVGYLILDLRAWGGGPVRFVRCLEEGVIRALARFGIPARRIEGLTGVWVGEEKICAIGVRVSRGVTYHGFALNVCPDLSFFRHIIPCGLPDRGVTSMERVLGRPISPEEVKAPLVEGLGEAFGLGMVWAGPATADAMRVGLAPA